MAVDENRLIEMLRQCELCRCVYRIRYTGSLPWSCGARGPGGYECPGPLVVLSGEWGEAVLAAHAVGGWGAAVAIIQATSEGWVQGTIENLYA